MRATCHMDWRWYSVVLKEACAPLCSWRDAGGSISWTACSPNTSQSSGQWTTTTQSWSESMGRIFRSSCRETNFLDLGQRLMDVCNWKWKDYFYFCFSTNIRAWLCEQAAVDLPELAFYKELICWLEFYQVLSWIFLFPFTLSDLVSTDPFVVKLRFEPSGRPESDVDYYLMVKENLCVVCGKRESYIRWVVQWVMRKTHKTGLKSASSLASRS